MCGVCGVIQVVGEPRLPVEAETLDRMTDAMVHRGPNDRGTHLAPGIALGARRLSIVDVAGGHQPFANEDGTVWGIQNGELYNHVEERRALESNGHRFRSRCDTEILPHLYEEYGTGFVERLRGKYGLAVWDDRRKRAVVARDRLGVKPIYWARSGDLVLFALRAEERPRERPRRLGARSRRDRRLSDARLLPRPADAAGRCQQADAGRAAHRRERPGARRALLEFPAPDPEPRPEDGVVGRADGGARRIDQAAADVGRPARRDAQRRARLQPDRRADGAQHVGAGEDVLRRLHGGRRRERARRRPRGGKDLRRRPSRARALVRAPGRRALGARVASRRAAGRSLVARVSRALEAGGARRSPSRSPARARTSFSAATRGTAMRRSRRACCGTGSRPRPDRGRGPVCARSHPPAREGARRPRPRRALSDLQPEHGRRRCARAARPRPARGASRARGARRRRRPSRRHRRRPAGDDALPRRPARRSSTTCSITSTARRWRARSRCECRSSTTRSSSSWRGSPRAEGATA